MAGGKNKTAKGLHGRGLRRDEADLWSKITTGVKPLRDRPVNAGPAPAPPAILKKPIPRAKQLDPKQTGPKQPTKTLPPLAKPRPSSTVPSSRTIDASLRRRLKRGQVAPDARLDLHGHTQATAHQALVHFINGSQAAGCRVVLIITGKGGSSYTRHTLHSSDFFHAPERKGVLRQGTLAWLAGPPLSDKIVGVHPAHPHHGGGGAIYVVLRRSTRRAY